MLRVHIESAIAHRLADSPNAVESRHVHAVSRNDLENARRQESECIKAKQLDLIIEVHGARITTMRKSGVVKARYSASLPVSQARIIQLDAEIMAAMLSAAITE